jgi:hypothetical protein
LYFLAGRLFLRNTKNALTDVFSVGLLFVVLFIEITYFWSNGAVILPLPIYPLVNAFAHVFVLTDGAIERKYIFMILSPLFPLSMWAGLGAKRYIDNIQIQQQSALKNRLLLIISKKKESMILFITLIFSAYLSLAILFVISIILFLCGIDLSD